MIFWGFVVQTESNCIRPQKKLLRDSPALLGLNGIIYEKLAPDSKFYLDYFNKFAVECNNTCDHFICRTLIRLIQIIQLSLKEMNQVIRPLNINLVIES